MKVSNSPAFKQLQYECKIVNTPLGCATHQAFAVRSIGNPDKVTTIGYYPLKTKGGLLSNRLLGMCVSPVTALFESTGKHGAVLLSNDPMFDKVDISQDGWVRVNKTAELDRLLNVMRDKKYTKESSIKGLYYQSVPVTDLQEILPQNLGETYHAAASICPQSWIDYFRIANCQTVAVLLGEYFGGPKIKAE